MEEISNETARTAPALLKFRGKIRKVGGNLVVTVPREVAEEEGVKPGELVNIEVRKPKKSFFGIDRGVGPFTRDDEMTDHDSV